MAYTRRRTTKAGAVSTALIKSYRDEKGRPHQRLLANLHGEPDTLRALAKLAAQRETLRKEREALATDKMAADEFYEIVTQQTLHGHQYSDSERKEIDGLMKKREHLLRRLAKVEGDLATIQKDGAVIKKHCSATPDEIQAAVKAYKLELSDAEAQMLGLEFVYKEAKAAFRRMSI